MPKRVKPHVHYESCRGIRDPLSRTKRAACHRTAWHTTRCHGRGGGKKKKDTTYSRFNRMHSSGNLEFWRGSASLVWVCAWPFCPSGGVAVGWVWNEEKPPWWMSTPPNADWHLELNWNTVAILWQNAYNCSRCTRTTIRYLYLRLDHHETGVTASVSPCNKTPLVP